MTVYETYKQSIERKLDSLLDLVNSMNQPSTDAATQATIDDLTKRLKAESSALATAIASNTPAANT
jgi:hypothetical protein